MGFESSALCVDIHTKEYHWAMLADLCGDEDTARNMIKLAYYIPGVWVVTKEKDSSHTCGVFVNHDGDLIELIHGRD